MAEKPTEKKPSFAKASEGDGKKEEPSVAPASVKTTAGEKAMEGEGLKKQGEESKLSSSPIADARELEECEKKATEYLSGWQRERADFLNYKKEEMERIGELIEYAGEGFILKILPILDNFEIAVKKTREMKHEETRVEDLIKGFLQIKTQLEDFLKSLGVEEIRSLGEKFNPNFHEVVEEIEIKGKEKGTVVEEIQRGYKINGRLLRPAKVKVVK